MSRKSERLVNLTIALLATKRYLTKAEIFKNVAGYSGDAEAKDRMFERDKDDLRSLGITIELGTFDPLFEDEAGYRIKPESYALQLRDLDPLSVALLSQAGKVWRAAALGDSAQSGLRKLKSLGIESDFDSIVQLTTSVQEAPEQLPDLIEAISERRRAYFEYFDDELTSRIRNVEPYRLSNSRGYWYLIGFDTDRDALRTFRLDRFASSVNVKGGSAAYEIDTEGLEAEEADSDAHIETAKIAVRKDKGASLRFDATITEMNSEWDLIEVPYLNEQQLLRQILWVGDSAYVVSPENLRNKVISVLKDALVNHG